MPFSDRDEPFSARTRTLAARGRAWRSFAAVAVGVALSHVLSPHASHIHKIVGDIPISALLFGLAGLASSLTVVLPGAVGRAAVFAAMLLLGGAVHHARICEQPRDSLGHLLGGAGQPGDPPLLVRLEGRVLSHPESGAPPPGTLDAMLARFESPSARMPILVDTLIAGSQSRPAWGRIFVYAPLLEDISIRPGRRIRLVGMFHRPQPAKNPGQTDPISWANQSGRVGWVSTNAGAIEMLPPRGALDTVASWPYAILAHLRAAATKMLDEQTEDSSPASGILKAMLLGERSSDGRQQAVFARTGVAHLLAISGFHLAVLVMLTVGIVRLTGDRPRAEALIGLLVIAIYLAVVPCRTPIVRAGLLAGSMLVAHFLSRKWDRIALLGWIATLLIAWRPLDLFTLGFQLTVGVTALLLWLGDVRHPWTAGQSARIDAKPEQSIAGVGLRWTRSLAATSLLVWLVTAPVIIFHTGSFNPLTPVAVIIATPVATLVQILGMAGLITGSFSPGLGGWFMGLSESAASALVVSADAFDRAPFHLSLTRVSIIWTSAAVMAVLFALHRARLRDHRPWLVLAAVIAWLVIELGFSGGLSRRTAARVDMLSVGDGTCLLIRSGNDALLWDAGSLTPGIGVRDIPRALRHLGSPRVPVAVITHANIDHYAALPDAAPSIGLRRLYVSSPALETMRASRAGSAEALFLDEMNALGVEIEPITIGDTIPLGPSTLHVIWPPDAPLPATSARNDRSTVARLDVPTTDGLRRVLLTGDIQKTAMLMLLADADNQPLEADILELPHHGSYHDAAERFVAAVGPSVVLQSTGPSRLSYRRWDKAKRNIAIARGRWLITARDGAAWAEILVSGEIRSGSILDGR